MTTSTEVITIDIFCSVIDNYGDIGVCFRLAKELACYHHKITIYVDNYEALNTIEPQIPKDNKEHAFNKNIIIKYWSKTADKYTPSQVIIEAFACNLDKSYTDRFKPNNLWINLEYLTAEAWAESCHKLPSIQNNGIPKYFFFPGFTNKTGGLNFEEQTTDITPLHAKEHIVKLLNLPQELTSHFWVHIFTYETNKLIPLLRSILKQHSDALILLPNSRSTYFLEKNLSQYFTELKIKYPRAKWHIFNMVSQNNYNYIIKSCDLNIVRGEDSITQAVINGTPYLWHIYKQQDNAHFDKLKAFIELLTKDASVELKNIISEAFFNLNDTSSDEGINFDEFMIKYDEIFRLCTAWSKLLIQNNSLGRNLSEFINSCLDNE